MYLPPAFALNLDAQLVFELDNNGRVTGLTKYQNGEEHANAVAAQ